MILKWAWQKREDDSKLLEEEALTELSQSEKKEQRASGGNARMYRAIILFIIATAVGIFGGLMYIYGGVSGYFLAQIAGILLLCGAASVFIVAFIFLLVVGIAVNEKRIKENSQSN